MGIMCQEDMQYIACESNIDFRMFDGKSVLITGATGLIGQNLVFAFLAANQYLNINIEIFALVRDLGRAEKMFGNYGSLHFIVGNITESITLDVNVDYIIHAASQTSSRAFVDEPVETVMTAFEGTRNVLEYARKHPVISLLYMSTMEVYGSPLTDEKVYENHHTNLDTMKVRSCYPESKRMCENLCACYCAEYGVPVKVARLTQTFGPGVKYNDGRVFAEIARCAIEGKNIILHTKGETRRNYLYTADAVTGLLTVLLKGENGAAYNVANESTYCSIFDMASLVASECTDQPIQVIIQVEDEEKYGFAPVLHMNLDTSKLTELGWNAKYELKEMYSRMITDMLGVEQS